MTNTAWLPVDALAFMNDLAAKNYPLETGGVFMGYWANEAEVVITSITGPGPNSQATKHSYHPDHEWQREKVAALYEQSGRLDVYLGDWHSHPDEKAATLSWKDKRTIKRIATSREARCPRPVMAIVHGSVSFPKICFAVAEIQNSWLGYRRLKLTGATFKTYSQ